MAVPVCRQGTDERLADRSDECGGGRLLVVKLELAALDTLPENLDEHVAIAAAEDEALGVDGGVDRLGEQRVGASGGGERTAREDLGGCGDALGGAAAVVAGDLLEGLELAARRSPENLGKEVGLGREVAVRGAGGDAGTGCNALNRGRRVAAIGKLVERSAHDPLAHLGLSLLRPLGGPVGHRRKK